jgi:hypothetical protein
MTPAKTPALNSCVVCRIYSCILSQSERIYTVLVSDKGPFTIRFVRLLLEDACICTWYSVFVVTFSTEYEVSRCSFEVSIVKFFQIRLFNLM